MSDTSSLSRAQLGKRFISHSFVYGMARIASALASFILLPIYTHYLSPKDYGIIELLSMLTDFSAIFFGARVGQSFLRYYGMSKEQDRRSQILGSAFSVVSVIHLVGVSILVVGASVISRFLLGDAQYAQLVMLFAIALLFGGMSEIPMTYLRAESKAFYFLGFSLYRLILQICLNLLFVVHLDKGVFGVAVASVLAQGIYTTTLIVVVSRHKRFSFSMELAKELLSFSAPIIVAAVSMFIITYGDRYFIRLHMDLTAVGIYALAYKFGFMLFSIGWSPFQTMWDAERYNVYKNKNQHAMYPIIFSFVSVLFIYVGFGMSIWVDPVLHLMSDKSFWSAAGLVPIILLAYIFVALTGFVNMGIFISAKTKYFGIITLATAVATVAGYATMIPRFGLYGAAWVTVIAFFARFYAIYRIARGFFDMQLRWYPTVGALVLAGALVLCKNYLNNMLHPVLVAIILSVCFPVLAVVFRIVSLQQVTRGVRLILRRSPA